MIILSHIPKNVKKIGRHRNVAPSKIRKFFFVRLFYHFSWNKSTKPLVLDGLLIVHVKVNPVLAIIFGQHTKVVFSQQPVFVVEFVLTLFH